MAWAASAKRWRCSKSDALWRGVFDGGAPGFGLCRVHAGQLVLGGHDVRFVSQSGGQSAQVAALHAVQGRDSAQGGNRIATPVKNGHSDARNAAGRAGFGQGIAIFQGVVNAASQFAKSLVFAAAQSVEGHDVGNFIVGQMGQDGQAERANAHGPSVIDLQYFGVLWQVPLSLVQTHRVVTAANP
ncbi:MAG: hypothetical protein CFE38_18250 [Comamonadaceae bacterium PBBC1]|nr:MAG: hypothetical protein CFE38_18250 [Comamonadaceae bacterium PBBC1]